MPQRYVVLRCSSCAKKYTQEGHPSGARMGDHLVVYEMFRVRIQLGCDSCGSRMFRKVEDFTIQRDRIVGVPDHVLTLEEARVRAAEIHIERERRHVEFEEELNRSYWEDYVKESRKEEEERQQARFLATLPDIPDEAWPEEPGDGQGYWDGES